MAGFPIDRARFGTRVTGRKHAAACGGYPLFALGAGAAGELRIVGAAEKSVRKLKGHGASATASKPRAGEGR